LILFNNNLEATDDFRSIVLENRVLLDVRAPVEFNKGAFPFSVNIPLLDDEQRKLIGIRYKEEGNASAVQLGKELMGDGIKEAREAAWIDFLEKNQEAYLYCFRGGQRSKISQTWLHEKGINRPRLKGGYKAFRAYLMKESERISKNANKLILGGKTGSGKTILLNELMNTIDLEGLANHRGSSFGRHVSEQPSQIDFEDALAYKLIQHEACGHKHLIIEHESHNIGKIYMPKEIFNNLRKGNLIILEVAMSERVETIYDEYITQALIEYEMMYQEKAIEKLYEDTKSALFRVRKRMGSELFISLSSVIAQAFDEHIQKGDTGKHKVWIELLLRKYYDPMYDYQLSKSTLPVLFRGNKQEVKRFLELS